MKTDKEKIDLAKELIHFLQEKITIRELTSDLGTPDYYRVNKIKGKLKEVLDQL